MSGEEDSGVVVVEAVMLTGYQIDPAISKSLFYRERSPRAVLFRLYDGMRSIAFVKLLPGALFLALSMAAHAQPAASGLKFDSKLPVEPQIAALHQAWLAEHAPKKREDLSEELFEALIHDFDGDEDEIRTIADDLSRDGLPQHEIHATHPATPALLKPLATLDGAGLVGYPASPIFRRLSQHRIEAWTKTDGWLFNTNGRLLVHVSVPRRDGGGREWFGAFLPGGMWITTDLWGNDRQINCFNSKGKWLWELKGQDIVAKMPKSQESDIPIEPSTGWARADNTGRRWLVCLGTEFDRGYALVDAEGHFQTLPYQTDLWSHVYPRAMGVRGFYIDLFIDSDDGRETLYRNSAGHGMYVGWPAFGLTGWNWNWRRVIQGDGRDFGFWPYSHAFYIVQEGASGAPDKVWLFHHGKYEGETPGTVLGDSDDNGLLVTDPECHVVRLRREKNGPTAQSSIVFHWPDGSQAVPLTVYDDVKLGFFLRGPGIIGTDKNDVRRARGDAEIVLAGWQESIPDAPR